MLLIQQGYNVLDSLQVILGKVQDIVGQIEVGKGTIGKLLVDETLYNSLAGNRRPSAASHDQSEL